MTTKSSTDAASPAASPDAASPGPPPLTLPEVNYLVVMATNADDPADNSKIVEVLGKHPEPQCNAQGLDPSKLYTKVPDECCNTDSWDSVMATSPGAMINELPVNFEYENVDYSCPILQLSPTTFVRGHADCGFVELWSWSEGCKPEGVAWPMTDSTEANTHWERGSADSCNCEEEPVRGDGCFVGKTFPGVAYFFMLDGTNCRVTAEQAI